MRLTQVHFVSAITKMYNLGVFGPALGILFVLIVADKATHITTVASILILGCLVLVGEGKTIFHGSNKVKTIIVGARSRETE